MIQIWSSRNPQGYEYRQFGASDRTLLDFEGLALVTVMKKARLAKPDPVELNALLTPDPPPEQNLLPTDAPAPSGNAWLFEPAKPPEGQASPSDESIRNTSPGAAEQLDSDLPW